MRGGTSVVTGPVSDLCVIFGTAAGPARNVIKPSCYPRLRYDHSRYTAHRWRKDRGKDRPHCHPRPTRVSPRPADTVSRLGKTGRPIYAGFVAGWLRRGGQVSSRCLERPVSAMDGVICHDAMFSKLTQKVGDFSPDISGKSGVHEEKSAEFSPGRSLLGRLWKWIGTSNSVHDTIMQSSAFALSTNCYSCELGGLWFVSK